MLHSCRRRVAATDAAPDVYYYVIMVKVLVFWEWGEESSRVKSVSHLGMFLQAELFSTQRRIVLKTAVSDFKVA